MIYHLNKLPMNGYRQTLPMIQSFVEPVKKIMLSSREALVNYMTPLGLTSYHG